MHLFEVILIAAGLSMDAFAVAICKGLATREFSVKRMLCVGAWFGAFQALMPSIGYFLGSSFAEYIVKFDHWVAFVLLCVIGINMIRESRECEDEVSDDMSFKTMFLLAVATSIDALAVGITFALKNVNEVYSYIIIGVITFVLSGIGFFVGNRFGMKYRSRAELVGGAVLIVIGLKILLEDLSVINF